MKKLIIGLIALVVVASSASPLLASPISVGILWKYNTKASGTLLRNTFRKCATAEGAVAAGLETGPVDLALAALVGVGTVAFLREQV
ncbi:hypothetical protein IL308_13340 [Lactococcus lactis]|uniref:hypothetical protein n=1 Tax=Lactococcus lactis TaxID=1358 RepID=UPI0019120AC8|nr:hypothetical protein [Lactococcus lactis]MBK5077716.1 hypothetical protein [Lactococcus lactis]WDA67292.1 hypothetical protein IL310_00570 [Lactococcus lactis]